MKEAISHLQFFKSTIHYTLNHFIGKNISQQQGFALGLLERLSHASISLELILRNLQNENSLDFTAGLTIRAILLDFLIALNLYHSVSEIEDISEQEFEEISLKFCNEILADGLDQATNFIDNLYKFGFETEEKIREIHNNVARTYSYYFHPHIGDGTRPKVKFKKPLKASDMFEKLAKRDDTKQISRLYEIYQFYSKYDHFGKLYFDTIRRPFEESLKSITNSISLFINHVTVSHAILSSFSRGDEFIANQLKETAAYLENYLEIEQ